MSVRRRSTRIVWVLLIVLLAATLAGCGQGAPPDDTGTSDGSKEGGTITIAYPGATPPLPDPHRASAMSELSIAMMMADPLVWWENEEYYGVLAEDWEISDDVKTYTFHLREGVKFQNGEPLTAEAVKQNVKRIVNPDDPLYLAGVLAQVEEVEVVDELTVRFHLKASNADFLADIFYLWIVEPGSWENLGDNEAPAGSGAFEVTEYVSGERLVLERFDGYWAGKANLDEVIVRSIPEAGTMVLELETGSVDLIFFAPAKEVSRLEDAGFTTLPFSRVNWARLAINLSQVTDVQLRQAMSYALDRQSIIDTAYAGLGVPQTSLSVPNSWLDDPNFEGYPFDPEKAKEIMDEAGWLDTDGDGIREIDGEPIDLHLPCRGDDASWLTATQMIQQMYADVGIGTHITTADRMSFYTQVRVGDYDIAWWLSNAAPEPAIASGNLDSRQYWNVMQAEYPRIDELLALGKATADREVRKDYYGEINQIHRGEALEALGLWMYQTHVASTDLVGVSNSPMGVTYNAHLWYLEGK